MLFVHYCAFQLSVYRQSLRVVAVVVVVVVVAVVLVVVVLVVAVVTTRFVVEIQQHVVHAVAACV
jgi:hypothetical protein